MVVVRIAGVGHDDDHRRSFFGGDELVGHILHLSSFLPGGIGVRQAVQQIHGRIQLTGALIVTDRQIDIDQDILSEDFAVNGFGADLAVAQRLRPRDRRCRKEQDKDKADSFHRCFSVFYKDNNISNLVIFV